MSPLKQPLPLYHRSVKNMNALILNACKTIERQGYTHDFAGHCESMVSTIQQYLLSDIPGHILDDLCRNVTNNLKNDCPRKEKSWDRKGYVDPRILLSVYLHENMREFSVNIRLPNDEKFWIKKVFDLRKILVLDLSYVCTDKILEAVGNNCSLLEEVSIVSEASCYIPIRPYGEYATDHSFYKNSISNEGLKHLCKCKNLKKIMMDQVVRPECLVNVVSHDIIKEVIKSLPKLQYISYANVGTIVDTLVDEVSELQLTHIDDFDPHSSHIRSMDILCPNLQKLFVHQPIKEAERASSVDMMIALTESKLKISVLKLKYFPVDKHFEDFVKVKGSFLTFLHIFCSPSISSNEVFIIGSYCPNLENLLLTNLTGNQSRLENPISTKGTKMFTSLQSLILKGRGWSPHAILPVCLENCLDLNSVMLSNESNSDVIDDIINSVLLVNPLKKLTRFEILSGCFINYKTIGILAISCTELKYLSTVLHRDIEKEVEKKLMEEMKSRSININLQPTPFGRRYY